MTLRSTYLTGTRLQRLVGTELDTRETYDLPLRRRLWLWRRGFLSRSDYLYDLEDGRHRRYLTDYERFVRTPRINGEWTVALSNKLVCHWMLSPFDEHRPDVHGMVRDGRLLSVDADGPSVATPGSMPTDGGVAVETAATTTGDAGSEVRCLLEQEGRLVLKWIKGGGGHNVYLCEHRDGTYLVNDEAKSEAEFEALVADLQDYLVCEFAEQFDFGASLYPETTNTLRIITMCDEAGEPFVPIAIYRVGTDRSAPMDNFSQGGLSAEVDVETGELGPAAQLPEEELVFRDAHPDTGAPIAGEALPGWEPIRERILEIAAENAHVPYVGWDVVPTDESGGFQVIEGNSYPGAKSLQVHRPLLADDRVREFYERHDVLRR